MKVRILDEDGDELTNWTDATPDTSPRHWAVDMGDLLGRVAANMAGLHQCTLEITSEG